MTDSKRTPLYDAHKGLGARMIDFGGWQMPVQYKPGIIKEHKNVRERVGLFDVSHMGQAVLRGARAGEAVQWLITNNAGKMTDGSALYTVMCYEHGGIVDDCIVYRHGSDEYTIVLNAANVAKDLAWIRDATGSFDIEVHDASAETALIAVQGPKAVALVDRLSPADLAGIRPFHFTRADIAGVSCMAARTGYTGEDGFELACPSDRANALWTALLGEGESDGVMPIGLGARDTLRLEARLCLYGNDIDETTSPLEAGLGWVVKFKASDFIGKAALRAQKTAGVTRRLVGFQVTGRGIPRPGYAILDRDREDPVIGQVTSGTKGISVPGAIGLGYVPVAASTAGEHITIDCRGKDADAVIVKGKFYNRSDS